MNSFAPKNTRFVTGHPPHQTGPVPIRGHQAEEGPPRQREHNAFLLDHDGTAIVSLCEWLASCVRRSDAPTLEAMLATLGRDVEFVMGECPDVRASLARLRIAAGVDHVAQAHTREAPHEPATSNAPESGPTRTMPRATFFDEPEDGDEVTLPGYVFEGLPTTGRYRVSRG